MRRNLKFNFAPREAEYFHPFQVLVVVARHILGGSGADGISRFAPSDSGHAQADPLPWPRQQKFPPKQLCPYTQDCFNLKPRDVNLSHFDCVTY
jgi:hypothetical protein